MRNGERRSRAPWLALLGACTLWLVVQNTILAAALLWSEPRKALAIATVLLKTAAALVLEFWTSPALPLMLTAGVIGAMVTPALFGRQEREEIHHG